MQPFNSVLQKISEWNQNSKSNLTINGISNHELPFLIKTFNCSGFGPYQKGQNFIIFSDHDTAEDFFTVMKDQSPNTFYFPGLEILPYKDYFSSESNLLRRFKIISNLLESNDHFNLICTVESFLLFNPPDSFFKDNCFIIETSDILSPLELKEKLVSIGYSHSTTVEEPGTFSQKGQIFDVYPISSGPVRIQYFDDMIEEIFAIDPKSYKTNKNRSFQRINFFPSPGILTLDPYKSQLRKNLPMPSPQFRQKYEYRKRILDTLSSNQLFENYPSYLPLFFERKFTISDYFSPDKTNLILISSDKITLTHSELLEELRFDFEEKTLDENEDNLLPGPENLYKISTFEECFNKNFLSINELSIETSFGDNINDIIDLKIISSKGFFSDYINPSQDKVSYINNVFELIKKKFENNGNIVISTSTAAAKSEISFLIENHDFNSSILGRLKFETLSLDSGFYYPTEDLLVLSESDFFSHKKNKTKKYIKPNIDLFAEQLSSLTPGDYVIHSIHGIGKYLGLEPMEFGGNKTDYLTLLYAENDKIYVPVYKMNLIQKHSPASANLTVNNLRNKKFLLIKERAKKAAKTLAFDLLKLQAERQSAEAFAFSPPDHIYKEFELSFPFKETRDQINAAENVLNDMQKARPMDHLVCGDVGFGKTEIAMRAAFKAVLDKKQVAILVPTTILALQHYNSFMQRFKSFPVNIEFLSRFKKAKEAKTIKESLSDGKIDIIIGTHMLLSESVKFKNIGLVVIDEEQRFGVSHKEKLKLLKTTVDFLTLTATPIPRTLQLAFLGLRDLSLIQTAPPKRQSIKTYLIKEDKKTIKSAIEKEISRGGQVFFVHNRVQDIEIVKREIEELVPGIKITIGHGQMAEKELEKRITEFYLGKYQLLLCTTIIESGLDIPNANTMIIDRANTYGLAQLHQLRGRIGRSDKKAYAYFVIPKFKKLTSIAEQRLKALQTYADMGSGFSIASCDLEIRGAGDILGATQSGHIESIGLELYMELLKEAISELKGEKKTLQKDIEISTPFPSYLPTNYITDSKERLKNYKKLSNCSSQEELENLKVDLEDIFGPFPQEIANLFTTIAIRIALQFSGIKSIGVAGSVININFDQAVLDKNSDLKEKVIQTFMARPKVYKLRPNYSVIYTHKESITGEVMLNFAKDIAEQLVT